MSFSLSKISSVFNFKLFFPAFLLTLFGIVSIYGIASGKGDLSNFKKQIFFFLIAIAIFFLLSVLDLRFLKVNSSLLFFFYLLSLLSLLGLFFLGKEIRGVKGWYKIGSFSFDPVPFTAVILIIVLSKYFSFRHTETKRISPIIFSGLYTLFPVLLVLLQPDLGSSLILVFIWVGIIIFSGIELRHFLILSLVAVVLFVLAWNFLFKDYQKERITAFLRPGIDPQGISWNILQSKIAIGSGGILGKGIKGGTQTRYGFLPEAQTDFIFAALAEQVGFLGVLAFCFLVLFLFWQITRIAFVAFDNFTRLFAAGFAFWFIAQSFINIGMNLGILPIIGIPLPFLSYGGSNLLGFYLGLGILSSLTRRA
jgi:rod shape determining protein RodA